MQRAQKFAVPVTAAILSITFLSACGLHQGSPKVTPTPAPTSTPTPSGTIKGIAARCEGLVRQPPRNSSVTVRVYRWNHRKKSPIATAVTNMKQKNRYSVRLRPGHYWVVAFPSPDRGVAIQLPAGATRVANFPNVCM